MPIVTVSGNPVSLEFVESMARPGGNITGASGVAHLASYLLYNRDGALAFLFGDDADLAPDLPAR